MTFCDAVAASTSIRTTIPPYPDIIEHRCDLSGVIAQSVEVDTGEIRIMGSKSRLLQALVANSGINALPARGSY